MRKLRIDGDIYKSNPLIEASINMNTIMGRIYTLGLLQVYPDLTGKLHPTDFETVRIPAKKVKELSNNNNNMANKEYKIGDKIKWGEYNTACKKSSN